VYLPRALTSALRAALAAGIVGERHGGHVALRPFRVAGAGFGRPHQQRTRRRPPAPPAPRRRDDRRHTDPVRADRARHAIRTPGRPFDFGLNWFRSPADRNARPWFVEHWGTGGGFWNAMRLYPQLGLGIVIMANTTRAYDHHRL
jgi:CubicO group peptidase (beta-lactamase class C family)